jgi:ribosome-binding factor A
MNGIIKRQLVITRKEKLPEAAKDCGRLSQRNVLAEAHKVASACGFIDTTNMSTRRTVRVAEVLRKELAACMSQSLDLEGLLITISSVELPPDMRQAYVYVSTLHPELEEEQALHVLNRNRKSWQSFIGRRLGLKFTPQLIFRFDRAIERGDRVMEILTKLELEKEKPGKSQPPA